MVIKNNAKPMLCHCPQCYHCLLNIFSGDKSKNDKDTRLVRDFEGDVMNMTMIVEDVICKRLYHKIVDWGALMNDVTHYSRHIRHTIQLPSTKKVVFVKMEKKIMFWKQFFIDGGRKSIGIACTNKFGRDEWMNEWMNRLFSLV